MKTIGTVMPRLLRRRPASSKTLSVVVPASRALMLACWITGPSAVGSENGMPSSISDAPADCIATTHSSVVAISGYPHVINGINAFPDVKADLMLLIDVLPSVARDCRTVFVSASGDRYYDDFVTVKRRREFHRVGDGVSRLDRRNNAFYTREILKCGDGFIV